MSIRKTVAAIVIALGLTAQGAAAAELGIADFERPAGVASGHFQHERPLGMSRDENGNSVRVVGAGGQASSVALGNLISVNQSGHNNTAIVVANQKNTGNISSKLVLNGRLNLN